MIVKAQAFREPDGQYSWLYFKDGNFIEVGGANLTLNACFNAMRDKVAAEPGVGNATTVDLQVVIP